MNPVASCAATFLEAHPHPALKIGELLTPVAERVDRTLTSRRLRHALSEHPDVFRLLDPWTGPWRTLHHHDRAREADAPRDPDLDVWVVLLTRPAASAPPPGTPALHLTLRESVRWLAGCVDERSPLSVSRWYALALAERDARRALARRANAA